ncbi:STE24 endopeptidase [Thermanaeromonas toyohensis ToBE]|uniref:STE24 endopeptidase n=1 Tax=Thermanaeromonas toyohensis ToBE TaxID=698762 RepID=A0A1W1VZF0_9FIRM|nr:M48 family metallopeptidase [Thermanaeromonas toyohensis]SMB98739.1 STE24 endopeptidase [Thermanaeromonas toyohensis ToBE]
MTERMGKELAKASILWGLLLGLVALLITLYLFFLILPTPVPSLVWQYFTSLDVERARRYQQVMRFSSLLAYLAKTGLLLWLWWSGRAAALSSGALRWSGQRYYLAAGLFFISIWLLLKAVNFPFAFYSGFILQHRWGFSTQTLASWWVDYIKASGIDLLLSGTGTLLFFWSTGRWPFTWWVAAGLFFAVWLLVETFLWPVVLAPLFNRFEPLKEGPVKSMVVALSERAGLKVKEVWVMDASRRTTKANAYFTGLGKTKRIVLYDNLLRDYSPEEVEAVVAHEMAHWKKGHIVKGLLWGMVGGFIFFVLLYDILRLTAPGEIIPGRPYPPHFLVITLVFLQLISFLAQPVENAFSRRQEAEADRVALELTRNPSVMVELHVDLARRNLQEVAPSAFIEWLTYSHPAPWRRIEAALKGGEKN